MSAQPLEGPGEIGLHWDFDRTTGSDDAEQHASAIRILRPGGSVAILWNQRTDTPLNRDYETMLERFEPDYPKGLPRDGAAEPKVRAFFAPAATSMITSKPANDDHFKTGQRGGETGVIYAVASAVGKFDV